MEYCVYVAIVFVLTCITIAVAISIPRDKPQGSDWWVVLSLFGVLSTFLMLFGTSVASEIQKENLAQPAASDGVRTTTEFLIYTGLVFAWFILLGLLGLFSEWCSSGCSI